MKTKTILMFIILMTGLLSCEKTEFKKDISGLWQFDGAGGGLSGSWTKTNTFTHLRLKKNNRYYIYNSDIIVASGEYSIYETGINNNEYFEPYYIKFKSADNSIISFPLNIDLDISIFEENTLIFGERNMVDGLQFYFTKN